MEDAPIATHMPKSKPSGIQAQEKEIWPSPRPFDQVKGGEGNLF